MKTPEQEQAANKSIALGLLRIAISPLVVRTVLFFLLCIAILLVLVFGVGIPMSRLWELALLLPLLALAFALRTLKNSKLEPLQGPRVYDKAEYHDDEVVPKGLPRKQAFVHTGMFVGWLIEHDMIAKDFLEKTQGFKERKITGAQVYKAWDGCLIDYMLTDEGNAFAKYYYNGEDGQGGLYFDDYEAALVGDLPSLYHVKDTWENYDVIKKKIDQRYEAWEKRAVA
jgi:hypothetical protein